jgi:hypothetical protein
MMSMLRRGLETSLFRGHDDLVYKIGPRVQNEVEILKQLQGCEPKVCPRLLRSDKDSLCFSLGEDVQGVFEEVSVKILASQLFWHLYLIHECGIVHGDIKPSNVLRMSREPEQYVFCDWDSAAKWQPGMDIPQRRCTRGFCETLLFSCTSPHDFDLLGLYWTVAFMHACQSEKKHIGTSTWLMSQVAAVTPSQGASAQVQWFLRGQVRDQRLTHPQDLVKAFFELRRAEMSKVEWIEKVREKEGREGWPACPDSLLSVFFSKNN